MYNIWNKAARKMYSLPCHTHRWILDTLTNQRHIRYQFLPSFNISILEHDFKYCLEHVKPEPLSVERKLLVHCLHELSLAKCSQLIINRFISDEIDDMITFICSK